VIRLHVAQAAVREEAARWLTIAIAGTHLPFAGVQASIPGMPNAPLPAVPEHLHLAVGADHAPDLLQTLRDRLSGANCVLAHDGGAIDAITTELPSATGGIAIIVISGATLARTATPILLEIIRSKRRHLRIVHPDGYSVEIDGEVSSVQLEGLLDDAIAAHSNSQESPAI
jgi:hypothetical protein